MKKFLIQNKFYFFSSIFLIGVWRLFLILPDYLGRYIYQHPGYIGPVSWANMDGIHYLLIGSRGYVLGERAFFPIYPFMIQFLRFHFPAVSRIEYALGISYIAIFVALIFLEKLVEIDFPKKTALWSIIFLLFFPTGFFFASVYTESLFLALIVVSFYLARKKKFLLASVFAGIASATRLVGIFLAASILIEYIVLYKKRIRLTLKEWVEAIGIIFISSSGLLGYMYYCWRTANDPIRFVHVQSIYGANRTNGKIILLPQVLFRYAKILLTIPYTNHDFWIALLEIACFFLFLSVLIVFWKKIRLSYLFFSLASILLPTLTGTLSSMPRYVLVAFPVFFILGDIRNTKIKILILVAFIIVLVVATTYFLRGYFIA